MNKRSPVVLFDRNAETESFKRPDHNDFATSSELVNRQFTGLRNNSLTGAYEVWVSGEVKETVTLGQIEMNPMALSDAYGKVFGLIRAA